MDQMIYRPRSVPHAKRHKNPEKIQNKRGSGRRDQGVRGGGWGELNEGIGYTNYLPLVYLRSKIIYTAIGGTRDPACD